MPLKHYRTEVENGNVKIFHIVDGKICLIPEKIRHYCDHCNGTMLPRVQYTLEHIQKLKITNHPAVPTLKKLLGEWNENLKTIGLYHKYHLWYWWSDPETDAGEGRVLRKSRQQMVWTVMHVAQRLENMLVAECLENMHVTERLENLPSEMWLLIMTFVKHE
jgi:hypothetical protein